MTKKTHSPFDHYLLCLLISGVNLQKGQPLLILANKREAAMVERLIGLSISLGSGPVEILSYQD